MALALTGVIAVLGGGGRAENDSSVGLCRSVDAVVREKRAGDDAMGEGRWLSRSTCSCDAVNATGELAVGGGGGAMPNGGVPGVVCG